MGKIVQSGHIGLSISCLKTAYFVADSCPASQALTTSWKEYEAVDSGVSVPDISAGSRKAAPETKLFQHRISYAIGGSAQIKLRHQTPAGF